MESGPKVPETARAAAEPPASITGRHADDSRTAVARVVGRIDPDFITDRNATNGPATDAPARTLTHRDESTTLTTMTKRLQVLLDDDDLREIQRLARRHHLTTAEWVRRSLQAAREADGGSDLGQKLAAVRTAAAHAFPAPDIEILLDEIERGYGGATESADLDPGT